MWHGSTDKDLDDGEEVVPADNLPEAGPWPRVGMAPAERSAGLQGARDALHGFDSTSSGLTICESWVLASTCTRGERQLEAASGSQEVACRALVNGYESVM